MNCVGCGQVLVRKVRPSGRSETDREFASRQYCSARCRHSEQRSIVESSTEPPSIDGARWIHLGHGRFALVDADLFDELRCYPWQFYPGGSVGHVACTIKVEGRKRSLYLHRVIAKATPSEKVDHRNRDPLDNRRSNLRIATSTQNNANVGLKSDNRSGFKGVSFNRRMSRWQVFIKIDKRSRYLGLFDSPQEAALVYDKAAREQFGEFAWLNYPDES